MFDRRHLILGTLAASVATSAWSQTPPPAKAGETPVPGLPDPVETIDLWPKGAPGMPAAPPVETVDQRSNDPDLPDRAVRGITRPRLVVFRPRVPNGAAGLAMPGGGDRRFGSDKGG